MALNIIPLTTHPNQEVIVTVEVAGENLPLRVRLRYNTEGACWFLSVKDGKTGTLLIDSVPVITGQYPAHNLLAQHQHLGLGAAIIAPVSIDMINDNADLDNLGTEFVLLWGDDEA